MIHATHQATNEADFDVTPLGMGLPHPADQIDEDESFNQSAWDEWYCKRIRRSLDDPRPPVPHAEVIELTCQVINAVEARQARRFT